MSATLLSVQGTLKPDGTLELDNKLLLPAGRVQVTVQPVPQPLPGDAFWAVMEQIWAEQKARGHVPRSREEIDAELKSLRDEWEEHGRARECVAFSPDGKRIVSGSQDNTLKVWDAITGQETLTLGGVFALIFIKGHTMPVSSAAFSPDGKRIVSGSWDETLKVWDAPSKGTPTVSAA